MRHFFAPSLPRPSIAAIAASGLGGFAAIACLAALTEALPAALLMAPFGASCVLLFAVPASPLSQPRNVIGGHVVSTGIGLMLRAGLSGHWWALALGVGLAIAAMVALRVTHPPAGADPLVVFAANPGLSFVVFPVLTGAVLLVALAMLIHRLTGTPYPVQPPR